MNNLCILSMFKEEPLKRKQRKVKIYLNIFPLAIIHHFPMNQTIFREIYTKYTFTTQKWEKKFLDSIKHKNNAMIAVESVSKLTNPIREKSILEYGVVACKFSGTFIWQNRFDDNALRWMQNGALQCDFWSWPEPILIVEMQKAIKVFTFSTSC